MITFSQDTSANDIYIDANGMLAISTGKQAYADIITDAIRTIRGELWSDTGFGVEYFGTVFARSNSIEAWKVQVRSIIQGFDFVKSISEFNTEYDSNSHTLNFKIVIETDQGTVEVDD